ncbi:hypothetical protein Tco_1097468, partial [Tanacetum coccineum]
MGSTEISEGGLLGIIEKKKNDDEEYYESRRKTVKRVAQR